MNELETYFGRQTRGRLPDGFKKDLADLLKLSGAARSALAKNVAKFLLLKDEDERQSLASELDAKFGNEPVALEGPIRVLVNFASIFLSEFERNPAANDDPVKIAADFGKMEKMYPDDFPDAEKTFAEALKIVKEAALTAKQQVLKKSSESGVLPVFNSFGATVELRAILDSKYKIGQGVDVYNPSITGFVGIASIYIGLDSGHPKSIAFQMTDYDLTSLIEALQATHKELRAIEQSIKANEKTAR